MVISTFTLILLTGPDLTAPDNEKGPKRFRSGPFRFSRRIGV
jgi:hypothetical protein